MKKQDHVILVFFGFFLTEVTSHYDFWGNPTGCPDSQYRSSDGFCNNLIFPAIGIPRTPYSRLAPPNYGDGFSTPSIAKSGNPLPLARLISLTLFPDVEVHDPKFTLLTMQYGQFISHDMSALISNTDATNCCPTTRQQLPQNCFPIMLPNNDPQTLATGKTCMNFVRSVTDRDLNFLNTDKPVEQITEVSQFLDLSQVYGDTGANGPRLREFRSGRLLAARRGGKDWLPQNPNVTSACPALQSLNEPCYLGGDMRTNQNPQLAAIQVIMLREHNRIAGILEKLNPHWDDEKLYQEARQIAIAQHQLIAYYEWMPLVLGVRNLISNKVIYGTQDFVNDYDETVNPAVSNEHANAAFRYFHTSIVGQLDFITELREQAGRIRLSDWFNRPGIIENGNLDFLLRGVATQPESNSDEFSTNEITQFLFKRPGPTFGDDLQATDIQRGRDHGLATYNDIRQKCGMQKARTFRDFEDVIPREQVEKLASLYESPDDVDLSVGGSLENIVDGTIVGPTFLCILTEQFLRTRVGDRFFFENRNPFGGFNIDQLQEIRKSSIARLFCDNGDNIRRMQVHGFERISESNPVVSCDKLPFVDLNDWKE